MSRGYERNLIGIVSDDVVGMIPDLLHDGLRGRKTLYDFPARCTREIPNDCGVAESVGQRGEKFWQRNLAVVHREQCAEQRQHRVARGKRGENFTVAFDVGASEKAAIGFPSTDAMTPFGDGALHTSDHVGAADFRLRFGNTG